MADGVWKCVYPQVFGHSKQLSQNKFFDPSTPSIRKGRDRGKNGKYGEKTGWGGELMKILATTSFASSLPPNDDR